MWLEGDDYDSVMVFGRHLFPVSLGYEEHFLKFLEICFGRQSCARISQQFRGKRVPFWPERKVCQREDLARALSSPKGSSRASEPSWLHC